MSTSSLNPTHTLNEKPNIFPMKCKKKSNTFVCCHNTNGNVRSTNGSPSLLTKSLEMNAGIDLITPYRLLESTSANLMDYNEGIGIVDFLKGKSLFITGATGFLAKVLIEKILRTAPDVGKIYVLIKAKNKEAGMDRLKNEIVNTELFDVLKKSHGKNYQDFMFNKLVPVIGNVREPRMGLDANMADEISNEVDVIVNSAANTTFDERYDVALDINTIGPFRLMSFAKRFKKLLLFLHVSTAYVNGQRQGRVMEKAFCIGDTIASEKVSSKFTLPTLDIENEIKLAFASQILASDASSIQKLRDLGIVRAKMFGWQDTYVFTKAMGEMVINSMRGDIPVVTIRPSVIESTLDDPFSGWIEGNRMMDPIVLYYGKGQLNGFPVDPDGVLDVVPADMVVNVTLAAMAKHGQSTVPGMHIYHAASSVVNPLLFKDLARNLHDHFTNSPCLDSKGKPIIVRPMELFKDIDDFTSYILDDAIKRCGNRNLPQRLKNIFMKSVEQAKSLATIYEPYTFYGGRFDNTNMRNLMKEMSEEEKRSFGFDVGGIDWDDYITKVHIHGLRKHVMKGRGMCNAADAQLVSVKK